MVGYSENSNTYKIWNGRKIIETKDVLFDEDSYQFKYSDHVPNEIESSHNEIEDTEHDSIYINVPNESAIIPTTPASSTLMNISTPGQTVPGEQSSYFTGVPVNTINDSNIENIDLHQLPFYFSSILDEAIRNSTSSSNFYTSSEPAATNENEDLINLRLTTRRDTGLNGPAWQNMPPLNTNARITRAQARFLASQLLQQRENNNEQTKYTFESLINDAVHFVDTIPSNYQAMLRSSDASHWSGAIAREYEALPQS